MPQCATGFAWIQSWHGAQTMSVLRRILAMRAAHAGWPGPGFPSSWTGDLVNCHRGAGLAEFAFPLRSRAEQLLAGDADPDGTGR